MTNIIEIVLAAEKLIFIQLNNVEDDYISGKALRISFVYIINCVLDHYDYSELRTETISTVII